MFAITMWCCSVGVGAGPEKSTEVLEPGECDLGQTAEATAIDAGP